MNISDLSVIGRDLVSRVDLALTSDGHALLIYAAPPCVIHPLNSPSAHRYLTTMITFGPVAFDMLLAPRLPELSVAVPFVARFTVSGRPVFAYTPAPLEPADCETLFEINPPIPMLLFGQNIVANRTVYERTMKNKGGHS